MNCSIRLELEFASIEDGLICAKKAQDVVIPLLVFQKSLCSANMAQGFIASLVVEFSVGVMLATTPEIDAKPQQ